MKYDDKPLTKEEKLNHIRRCEYHRGSKLGICPYVSKEEAEKLKDERYGRV